MKIIGHRGAAGLALENTIVSIKLAKLLGVDAIELDVRLTKDKQVVICHDDDLSRVSHSTKKLSELTAEGIKDIPLYDVESRVPLLSEALELIDDTPVIIEIKEAGMARILLNVLEQFPETTVIIASFKLKELALLRDLQPNLKFYGLEGTHAIESIQSAKMLGLNGVGLNFWLLNPLTYWLAHRAKLDLFVYTVNYRFLGKFLRFLYPQVALCTDHPEWFTKPPKVSPKKPRPAQKKER